ncbi:MAG: Eco57I restriction-modification methylase domain-containing protein [Bacteroidota bacterium]
MPEKHQPLFNVAYLRSLWAEDYENFKSSPESAALHDRLKNWAAKDRQKETASEAAFIDVFFKKIWGYYASGEKDKEQGYTIYQRFPVKGAGQKGGTGAADIALGYFGRSDMEEIPQVLGEFKDDQTGLDKPQLTRPNDRSPVDQCLDYLRESRKGLISSLLPTWGIVTDMNEFRLYFYGNKSQYQRFVINPKGGDQAISLLGDSEANEFQRFLFYRIFHLEWLLTVGGKSQLEVILTDQILHEKSLENEFYIEYQAFREEIYKELRQKNPQYEQQGLLKTLVKFTQRILDRCLFILYCEDMGRELNFPPNILRDVLIEIGASKFYSPEAENAWTEVKRLFQSMREGTPFGSERINRFNGGLFQEDPEMDALSLSNRIFCERNQGQSTERILQFPKTLLYFSAKYNFGVESLGRGRTLSLTAMGRIFEQSITELEAMEAHAEGRESLTELTKRKRDGVYYTPEWVTHYIVEETVGARLKEIRQELGVNELEDITDEQIRAHLRDGRKERVVRKYEKALNAYREKLDELKVVDPACGSGAFLIQAFKFLYQERQWIASELARLAGGEKDYVDVHSLMSGVLSKNIYGVDINPESVEITRLALWLNTALPDRPLTYLDKNIRCGNSLIGNDFYKQPCIDKDALNEYELDLINPFDWAEAFPEVFGSGDPGFDCVIGNPPYVKLQHFRRVQEDVATYLLEAERESDKPMYESTQTGNFDLYLPFIEKGVELLNNFGKMGYIAPNVWLLNEYGKGLRKKIKATRQLDRWVDFKSYQVFDEATTYTALQFFSGVANDSIKCVFAPNGAKDIASVEWNKVEDLVRYKDLSEDDSWVFVTNAEKALINKVSNACQKLEAACKGITVGIQTSADHIYHLTRLGTNRYLHKPKGKKEYVEIEIEDEIMRPLVSGHDTKRYQTPITSTYLLFPYKVRKGKAYLFSSKEMVTWFPKAWQYLKMSEKVLRNREKGKMNKDNSWWAYNYPKNLDKQEIPKLMVPRLVKNLFAAVDENGSFYLDNVDVNGVLVEEPSDLFFLCGILNAPVANFVWRRISKPFQNDYRSANKQFIAPLPIPCPTDTEKTEVVNLSHHLQQLHSRRRDLLKMIDKRLLSEQCEDKNLDESWLWADVKALKEVKKEGPKDLKGKELSDWGKIERERRLAVHLGPITQMLRPGAMLTVEDDYGELKLLIEGMAMIDGIFLDEKEADFIAAQWRQKIRKLNITEKFDGKKLLNLLLKLRETDNKAIIEQIIQIDSDIQALDAEIAEAEAKMNSLTYKLYNLTEEEIRLVEGGS